MNNQQPEFDFDQRFNGPDFIPEFDQERLTGQIKTIHHLMIDEKWRTLSEIEHLTGYPQASISAQLRHLRKERFGRHTVDKRRRGESARDQETRAEQKFRPRMVLVLSGVSIYRLKRSG